MTSSSLRKGDHFRCKTCLTVFTWSGTVFAVLMSLLSILALVILLLQVDGRAILNWDCKITPNTIVSILVQISQGLSGVVNGAVVFQMGVLWFKNCQRRACDLDTIFRASHGVHANLQLVLTRRIWARMTIPATLACIGLAMGPFAQNTVIIVRRAVTDLPAHVPRAQVYNYSMFPDFPGLPDPGMPMKHAWDNAWCGPESGVDVKTLGLQPVCPTGNCTFPQFQTLGALGKCVDLSSNVTQLCTSGDHTNNCTYKLAGSTLSLSDLHTNFNMTTNVDFSIGENTLGVPQQLTNFDALAKARNESIIAARCVTYAAILTLNSAVQNGFPMESEAQQPWVNSTATFGFDELSPLQFFSLLPPNAPSNEPFYLANNSVYAIQNYGRSVFSGLANDTSEVIPRLVYEAMDKGTLSQRNDDMATAMSLQFRLRDAKGSLVLGQSHRSVEVFKVRWPWMSLPLFVPIATSTALVFIVVSSRLRKERKYQADAYTLLEMAPADLSRTKLATKTGSSRIRPTASRTYFELQGLAEDARLHFVRYEGPPRWPITQQVTSKMTENTEGGLSQAAQSFENSVS